MNKVPITRSGYHRLLRELAFLRGVVRVEVLEDLREARAFGLRVDNQQYLLARERCLVLDRKIHDLEERLAHCEVFAGRKFARKRIAFGAVSLIRNLATGESHSYELVGPFESDATNGRIAVDSPLGAALMGRREGDEIALVTPGGLRTYRILAISLS